MSTNFKSISISITADFVRPTVPDYEESSQTIIFTTADKFEECFKKGAFSHSNSSGSSFLKLCQFTPPSICMIMLVSIRRKLRIAQVTIDTTNVVSSVDNNQGSSSNELEVMCPKKTHRLIYLLSQVVALDYWQDTIKAAHDFGGFRLTANEEKKRRTAYCIDYDFACSIVEQLEENVYQCRPFTEDILFYEMDTKEGFLKNYSCPDQTKMCKHIFLVSRITKLPFSPRAPAPVAQQERFSVPNEDQGLLCREI
ncbi:hypothetical protein G6F71_001855 [Rhizopus microsporus]|nr:hypothetical protein G6F71_001855 [Rhizopus microsporus]KAG1216271.1 hypothetical protein G6F69_000189 [Rhizopus microsporus]KAG1265048.1 hypothetical protein G6F68_003893 [Rhizopus microsporus]